MSKMCGINIILRDQFLYFVCARSGAGGGEGRGVFLEYFSLYSHLDELYYDGFDLEIYWCVSTIIKKIFFFIFIFCVGFLCSVFLLSCFFSVCLLPASFYFLSTPSLLQGNKGVLLLFFFSNSSTFKITGDMHVSVLKWALGWEGMSVVVLGENSEYMMSKHCVVFNVQGLCKKKKVLKDCVENCQGIEWECA